MPNADQGRSCEDLEYDTTFYNVTVNKALNGNISISKKYLAFGALQLDIGKGM